MMPWYHCLQTMGSHWKNVNEWSLDLDAWISSKSYTSVLILFSWEWKVQRWSFMPHKTRILLAFRPQCLLTLSSSNVQIFDSGIYILQNKLLNRRSGGFSNELKVVCSGTEEYKKAKELRDLFLEFIDHQQGLYKKLCMEERSIS